LENLIPRILPRSDRTRGLWHHRPPRRPWGLLVALSWIAGREHALRRWRSRLALPYFLDPAPDAVHATLVAVDLGADCWRDRTRRVRTSTTGRPWKERRPRSHVAPQPDGAAAEWPIVPRSRIRAQTPPGPRSKVSSDQVHLLTGHRPACTPANPDSSGTPPSVTQS
jgi:hypothetical protein